MASVLSRPIHALLWYLAALVLHGAALGAEKTPLFIQVRTNQIIDRQVAEEFGPRASLVELRAPQGSPAAGYAFQDLVARFKSAAPNVPVLSYAWVSQQREQGGPIEFYLLRGLNLAPLAQVSGKDNVQFRYVDVTDPAVRQAVVERLAAERKRLGVDGFAVDLLFRTPSVQPKMLARICDQKPLFCEAYARSIDDILVTLNAALGEPGTLLYNGLWNLQPGMLADQARLLAHADTTMIEYFGMVPNLKRSGFTNQVLPYLEGMSRLPKGKPVLFYGRGPWHYTDYAADYRWQRYLYGSFLLARRKEDGFKYHASFQVPAHAGRTGALDVFADWNVDLGEPRGPYRVQDGLYEREFSNGRVVVAPDDGRGGRMRLAAPYYTPEGRPVSGEITLAPGEGLILLSAPDKSQPATRRIGARQIGAWGWAHADMLKTPQGERVGLRPLPPGLEGEHDVLLDRERSLIPFDRLEIDVTLLDPAAAVLAVAEVDDPGGRYAWAVVAVQGPGAARNAAPLREPVQFRTRPLPRDGSWPELRLEHNPGAGPIVLDGSRIFGKSDLRFRRWSHARFAGPVDVSAITLSQRQPVPH